MKSTTSAILILSIFICYFGILNAQKYTSRFDNIDVDQVLRNPRILNNYLKCLMEKGPCTPDGRELKKSLPDALASNCSKCTEVQKRNSGKVIGFLRDNKPTEWKQLLTKYDPTGNYQKQLAV